MTIQQLEYVVALATHKSFVKAAENCFVTQPTLTMQIQKLENEVGFLIVDRTKKPIQPTTLGYEFIQGAKEILSNISDLKSLINNEKESVNGTFRVGIIPTIAPYLLPLFLPRFIKDYPDTKLIIEELQSNIILEYLKQDRLDFAIISGPVNEAGIEEKKLYSEPFLAYLNDSDPLNKATSLTPEDLDSDALLLLSDGHCFRSQVLNICNSQHIEGENFTYKTGSFESIMALVDMDLGFTLIPELLVLKRKTMKNTKRFTKPEPVREITLISHNTFHKPLLLETIQKSILKSIPERFKKKGIVNRVKWR